MVLLIGIDPGIVDTGLVAIELYPESGTYHVEHRVWRDVTEQIDKTLIVKEDFLTHLVAEVDKLKSTSRSAMKLVGIEGYRNRGRDIRQDQRMTMLVQTIHKRLDRSMVIDNTGIKNVVTQPILGLFDFYFPGTNHADLWSAARIALKLGLSDLRINETLSDMVRAHVNGRSWESV